MSDSNKPLPKPMLTSVMILWLSSEGILDMSLKITHLTHWPLGDFDAILTLQFSILLCPLVSSLVFGLGRIFKLERSAIFMTEFRARLELGAINFHLKPCMFTWAKIGSPFEATILALYSKVSSYQLTSTEFVITT